MSGKGNEPKLEFGSTLMEFGPVLPHSAGDEREVMVRNPSSFPVEIYSLEFDKQYLEEEKVRETHFVIVAGRASHWDQKTQIAKPTSRKGAYLQCRS